jgi:ribosomal protein S18 acetylase RimI-like enzyme
MERGEITIRPIVAADANTVADLHATSWRDAYRGMLRDEYLDADVAGDRRQAWTARLGAPVDSEFGFIAEAAGEPVGFVFVLGRDDDLWGTLVDNLHVLPGFKGRGIGRRLLEAAALETARRYPGERVYLFVFDANAAARRFYAAVGGREVECATVEPPGGGSQMQWRVVWDDAERLLASVRSAPRSNQA